MNKIVLICPYFGKLPSYFRLTLTSMKNNPQIDWLIFTDDKTLYNYPDNVKVIYTDFSSIRSLISEKIMMDASSIKPYKLCDFKPFYGIIFDEYIKCYDFWGHCDFDCIFGRINYFLTDEILNSYEKILFLGHLSLYRNSKKMTNTLRRYFIECPHLKDMLQKDYPFQIDEVLIIKYLSDKKVSIFMNDESIADIYCLKKPFYITHSEIKTDSKSKKIRLYSTYKKNNGMIFSYQKGVLKSFFFGSKGNDIKEKEYMYIHLQKRSMCCKMDISEKSDDFLIVPNSFLPYRKIDKDFIQKYSNDSGVYMGFFKIKYRNLKNRVQLLLKGV